MASPHLGNPDWPIVLAWGRPHVTPPQPLHALVGVNHNGSHVTACRGRWSAKDPGELFIGAMVTQYPKCRACCAVTGDEAELPTFLPVRDSVEHHLADDRSHEPALSPIDTRLKAALIELRDAPAVVSPPYGVGVTMDWDTSDLEGES